MIEIKDRNGEPIEDGDEFNYTGTNPPVTGKRVKDRIIWSDGMESDLDEFWWDVVDSDHSEKIRK